MPVINVNELWRMCMEVLLGIHGVWDVIEPGLADAKKNNIVKGSSSTQIYSPGSSAPPRYSPGASTHSKLFSGIFKKHKVLKLQALA
uniref:Uncharacterized protein n=1 Tax=Tanacetum cinerariifolium TaxID=118510 RepID=A0A699KMB3_TANCI|nr:hypothetical protein [Tanacetum cinerariifolium]